MALRGKHEDHKRLIVIQAMMGACCKLMAVKEMSSGVGYIFLKESGCDESLDVGHERKKSKGECQKSVNT